MDKQIPTTENDTTQGSTDSHLSAATIFDLLANDRRRYALQYLTQAVGAVRVSDLADQIALWEGTHTHKRYERICTSLVHVHVPKLADAGVVLYVLERDTVDLLEPADQLVPYLELAPPAHTR